jgi:hypothetical protein
MITLALGIVALAGFATHVLAQKKQQEQQVTNSSENQPLVEMNKILSHLLLILLIGGIATGLLFPYLTNKWQKKQKQHELEFQLKVDLMKRINESVNETVMTATFSFRLIPDNILTEVYRKWEISSAELESDIKVYFPQTTKSNIAKRWGDYSQFLSEFYSLTVDSSKEGDISSKEIENSINKIRHYVNTVGIGTDIPLEGLLSPQVIERYYSYTKLAKGLMDKKGEILAEMFRTPTLIFSKE